MKKKIIMRGLAGIPIGIAVGYVITIVLSLVWSNGYYAPCVPELISAMGSEINAVILQAFLCGLLGMGAAAGSVIWEIDHWSIVKQTGSYFLLLSVFMIPAAYFNYWMEHSIAGLASYFLIFVIIFIMIWVVQFMIGKKEVGKLNENLYKARRDQKKQNGNS
ncbi:DUF3021 domain-containing protein [Lachnospiraceae bacterium]|nr:DUF3021 domain-containing protein [Lachnospiraceae bacterium]